ncbi:MAG: preprotein translocase subunit YajC [Gemmatimonadota bacterium]
MNSIPQHMLLLLQASPTPAPTGGGGIALTGFLFQLFAIGAIVYFLMIRPQQKQRRQHEERLRNLKRGDTIVTNGGIVGEVVHIKDSMKDGAAQKGMDDHITIKSGESRLIVERGRIARVVGETPAKAS